MSMKNGKRSRRKTEDELNPTPEFKAPIKKDKEEKAKIEEAVVVVEAESVIEETKAEENGVKEVEPVEEPSNGNPEPLVSDEMPKDSEKTEEIIIETAEEVVIETTEEQLVETEKTIDVVTTTEVETNGIDKDDATDDIEMEPLIVDAEEADPELQFDENSDPDSRKSSPVLSRCRTRRSQTRNIPTPKTPRAELNGDDDVSTATPDILDLNETRDSVESTTSTRVNVGSDFTREIDLTVPDEKESFLNTAKDLSVVETLRRISSRRTIRSLPDYRRNVLKLNAERNDFVMSRSSVEKVPGQKRKRSETPDGSKRLKMEPSSPAFFSFIMSPISSFRNRFVSGEVSASTPKLTSYNKRQDILADAEFSKIELEAEPPAEKKWCMIM